MADKRRRKRNKYRDWVPFGAYIGGIAVVAGIGYYINHHPPSDHCVNAVKAQDGFNALADKIEPLYYSSGDTSDEDKKLITHALELMAQYQGLVEKETSLCLGRPVNPNRLADVDR